MPPRYAYWTIIAGGLATAFRAADRDELAPTFHRIKEKHPDAEMKYFARGRLWESPEDARRAAERPQTRPPDWRPGGAHRDPRQRFKDAKKAVNQRRRTARFERRQASGPPGAGPGPKQGAGARGPRRPHGDPLRHHVAVGSPPRPPGPKRHGPGRPVPSRAGAPGGSAHPTRPTGPARPTRPGRPAGPERDRGPGPSHRNRGPKPPRDRRRR